MKFSITNILYAFILSGLMQCHSTKNTRETLKGESKSNSHYETVAIIDFQDNFNADTVSLTINKVSILKNYILTSQKEIGFAKRICIVTNNPISKLSEYKNDTLFLGLKENNRDMLRIKMKLNQFTIDTIFDIKNKQYIGFYKNLKEISIHQSLEMFQYD